ncbi:MAG: sensor histidine kinase, partial [Granulosicoccaceae bacterium]
EGFLLGLAGGFAMWFIILIVPLLVNSDILDQQINLSAIFGSGGSDIWGVATFWTLSVNACLMVLGSYATKNSDEEVEAAELCIHQGSRPLTGTVLALSPYQFTQQLEQVMGPSAAEKEVRNALAELSLSWQESRPAELRRLRERIELNLSGLLGPTLARLIVNDRLRLHKETHAALSDSFKRLEMRLENSRNRLRGAERELDEMRRYHRDVLHELPIGVCSLDTNGTVVIWNSTMVRISTIESSDALGQSVGSLAAPWGKLLQDFAKLDSGQSFKERVQRGDDTRSYNFHKSHILTSAAAPEARSGLVILVEDRTNIDQLEAELAHSERLASVGRFAAGVAHEIGNPLTGIDSLAQNLAHESDSEIVLSTGENIIKQTRRINDIVKSLLAFSRRESTGDSARESFPLHACIDDAIELMNLDPATRPIELSSNCPKNLEISADRQKILQLVLNLLSNACAASEAGDKVKVLVRAAGENCTIEVQDQGSGIDEAARDSIFDPFYTTKPVGKGTGLGLSLVHSIVEEHGGRISLDSSPGKGSSFKITLPTNTDSNTTEYSRT